MTPQAKQSLSPQQIRKISAFFLVLLVLALVGVATYQLVHQYLSGRITADSVAFGLPEGTVIGTPTKLGLELNKEEQESLETASRLLENRDYRAALEYYDRLLQAHPASAELLAGRAMVLLKSNLKSNQAELEGLQSLLQEKYATSPATAFFLGSLALVRGQNTLAVQSLEKASDANPTDAQYRIALSEALLRQGQPRQAATEARTAITLTLGKSSTSYAMLAKSLHDLGKLDSCAEVVEYASARFPSDVSLLVIAGWLKEYQGAYESAGLLYDKALILSPGDSMVLEAQKTLGGKSPPGDGGKGTVTPREKAQVAIDILEPLVTSYDENMPLHYALGMAYLKARMFDLAKEQFNIVAEDDPEYPDIQLRIQEAQSATQQSPEKTMQLNAQLQKGLDSLRGKPGERSFSERLGHYLVRWGAPAKEFFARYPVASFKQINPHVWEEVLWEEPLRLRTQVHFDAQYGLDEIRLWVQDTSKDASRPNRYYDLFGRLLGQNTRISGAGVATGESDCENLTFQGVVWENSDNFEIMAQIGEKKNEVRLLRLDPKRHQTMPRLCALIEDLHKN